MNGERTAKESYASIGSPEDLHQKLLYLPSCVALVTEICNNCSGSDYRLAYYCTALQIKAVSFAKAFIYLKIIVF